MEQKGMSILHLKLIVVVATLCDYLAWQFTERFSMAANVMHGIGHLAIPIVCFLLVEGYRHTNNLRRYVLRLIGVGILSMVPFQLFWNQYVGYRQNILVDLALALIALMVAEHKRFSKIIKLLIIALVLELSVWIAMYPILPILYVLIFYYKPTYKEWRNYFTWATVSILLLIHFVAAVYEMSLLLPVSGLWYDYFYLLGGFLAIPILSRYNGVGHSSKIGRGLFYFVYPLQLLLLVGLKALPDLWIYEIYVILHVFTIFTVIVLIIKTCSIQRTHPQPSHTVFLIFALMFIIGVFIEITAKDLQAILSAIKIEYCGEVGFVLGYLWFIDLFCKLRLKRWVYWGAYVISAITLWGVFTMEHNSWFYTYMAMDYSGVFPRIILSHGPIFYLFIGYFLVIVVASVFICMRRRKYSEGIERKRFTALAMGSLFPWFALGLNMSQVTGGYDMISFGMLGGATCFSIALIRYGYFNSIQAAHENALNHGKEGILVVDSSYHVLFYNTKLKQMYPTIDNDIDVSCIPSFKEIFSGTINTLDLDGIVYEMRVEPLIEGGYTQGYMLWAINMTKYYSVLERLQSQADTDALTQLNNRSCFEAKLRMYLMDRQPGTMCMLDMDNFKYINDTLGHHAGDEVLKAFSDVLVAVAKEKDLICRIGGDEFCMYLMGCTSKEVLSGIAQKVLESFSEALQNKSLPTITTVSMGLAVYNGEYEEDFFTLYGNADKALYLAKNNGKNAYYFYE